MVVIEYSYEKLIFRWNYKKPSVTFFQDTKIVVSVKAKIKVRIGYKYKEIQTTWGVWVEKYKQSFHYHFL